MKWFLAFLIWVFLATILDELDLEVFECPVGWMHFPLFVLVMGVTYLLP